MRRKFFILPLFSALSLLSCGKAEHLYYKYVASIISVHDGDTFTDEQNTIYRLYGVDTPEMSDQFNNFNNSQGIERIYAVEATQFTSMRIKNKIVQILKIGTEKYGRSIARVIYDKKDLSCELLKQGFARVAYIDRDKDSPYFCQDEKYYQTLLDAQFYAWKNKKGIWNHEKEFKVIFPKA